MSDNNDNLGLPSRGVPVLLNIMYPNNGVMSTGLQVRTDIVMNWACLLDDEDPMDDGLVACDGAEVRAHGAILSVASGVLRIILFPLRTCTWPPSTLARPRNDRQAESCPEWMHVLQLVAAVADVPTEFEERWNFLWLNASIKAVK